MSDIVNSTKSKRNGRSYNLKGLIDKIKIMHTEQDKIRNVAIIAHVDHGKTTLVDQLFRQSGMFRDNQKVAERLMDSMDHERERGITIASKNGSYEHNGHQVNIIDTPGHADFGGQVERVLRMADGAVLLVDAQEGPMPQTFFVVKKALAAGLPVMVVINKVDKPAARPEWVLDQVFDLLARLDAPDEVLDFPVVYASAKQGYALADLGDAIDEKHPMHPVSDMIINHVPAPVGNPDAPLQLQVNTIDFPPIWAASASVRSSMANWVSTMPLWLHAGTAALCRRGSIKYFHSRETRK